MITNVTDNFIEILPEDGMELFNGEITTNRITAPLGTDLSNWIERIKIEENYLKNIH